MDAILYDELKLSFFRNGGLYLNTCYINEFRLNISLF